MQLAGLVTSGLVRCKQTLVAAPGVKRDGKQVGPARDFRYRTEPTDLIGAAHEQLAWLVVSKEEARVCKGCGRWFLPSHGSQKHHAKDCGNSRRQRELRQRRKAGSSL